METENHQHGVKQLAAAASLAVAGGAYLAAQLRDGWFPWDEGSLALTAERVLMGELPHRDFMDLYTGGLTFLNAGAFRLFGTDLLSPRLVLLFAFLIWLVVLFKLCSRFLPTWLAALVTALSVVWSVPNYPAAVPSWYNLFFATGGLLAILVFSDSRNVRWAWIAGICGGLSICAKVVGVFFVLGVALFLVFDEQTSPGRSTDSAADKGYSLAFVLFSIVLILLVIRLVLRVGGASQIVNFVVPICALLSVLVIEEWRRLRSPTGGGSRFRSILGPAACFVGGVLVPLSILSIPYVMSGATLDLLEGVFLRPSPRFEFASLPAPPILSVVFTLAVAGALSLGLRVRRSVRWLHHAVLAVIGAAVVVAASRTWEAFMFAYLSAHNLTPIVIVAGCAWVAFAAAPENTRRSMFALLSATFGVGMVQFPYAGSIYFHYTAPLAILVLAALVWQIGSGRLSKSAIVIPWLFYFVFGVAVMNPQPPGSGGPSMSSGRWEELALPRARLRTTQPDSLVYGELVQILRTHGDRKLGYAGPDSPEIYFFAESYANEPVLFDFLLRDYGSPVDDPAYLDGFDLIVLNHKPEFSNPIRPSTLERLAGEFPLSAAAGDFEVRWRE